eukprot:7433706-Pyramimonas_sp.AAC.1
MPAIQYLVNAPGCMASHGVDENLRYQLEEARDATFFQVRGDELCAQSLKGARPGNGLADLVFNVSFARALGPPYVELQGGGCALDLQPLGQRAILTRGQLKDHEGSLPEVPVMDDATFLCVLRDNMAC